jgi:uncharacterized membrane protein YidH (DUF202 family)
MELIEKPVDPIEKAKKKAKKKELKIIGTERTRVSFERLQLAWLRTAITFVALGFTSYKFYLARTEEGKNHLVNFLNGRDIGLFLVLVGFLGLLQATIQHRRNQIRLKSIYPGLVYSVALIQSYFILGFTLILLFVMFYFI